MDALDDLTLHRRRARLLNPYTVSQVFLQEQMFQYIPPPAVPPAYVFNAPPQAYAGAPYVPFAPPVQSMGAKQDAFQVLPQPPPSQFKASGPIPPVPPPTYQPQPTTDTFQGMRDYFNVRTWSQARAEEETRRPPAENTRGAARRRQEFSAS